MTRLTHRLRRAGLAILIGLGVNASAQPAPSLDARLDRLAEAVDASADQRAALDRIASQYATAERSDLWAATAQVHDVLTREQIAQLQQSAEARRGRRAEGRQGRAEGPRGRAGRDRGDRRARRGGMRQESRGERPTLTEAQRDALRAIRDDARQQRQALVERLRAGTLSDDAFVAQTQALREATSRQVAAELPSEVAAEMTERQARREAARQAKDEALGLTSAQKAQLQTLRLDRLRNAPERPDLRPYLNDDGQLDRRALREAQQGQREAQQDARRAHREAMADVLTDEQREMIGLHRALAGPGGRAHRGGGRRGGGRR